MFKALGLVCGERIGLVQVGEYLDGILLCTEVGWQRKADATLLRQDGDGLEEFKDAALKIYSNADVTANWSEGLYENIRSWIA